MIIAFAPSHEALVEMERQFVNEEFLARPEVMNLTVGGFSDFSHISSDLRRVVCAANGAINGPVNVIHTHTPAAREKARTTMMLRYGRMSTYDGRGHLGKKASPELRLKLSAAAKLREFNKRSAT